MDEFRSDGTDGAIADLISDLGRRVTASPNHRARLRNDLMRRYYQLQREPVATSSIWRLPAPLRRRRVFMLPALLVAAVGGLLVSVLPFSDHAQPQTVEAQIVSRLAQSAPYITGVQWTLRREASGKTSVVRLGLQFGKTQRLYIYHHQPYLWQKDHWSLVPASDTIDSNNTFYWETAFASLPTRLGQNHATRLSNRLVDGHVALGLRYSTQENSRSKTITTTCWIDQATSLLIRLERVTSRGETVVQREVANYSYTYQKTV